MKQPFRMIIPILAMQLLAGAQGADNSTTEAAAADRVSARPERTITTLGFGSCTHEDRPAPIWDAIHASHCDAFVLCGDNIYGDSADPLVPNTRMRRPLVYPALALLNHI